MKRRVFALAVAALAGLTVSLAWLVPPAAAQSQDFFVPNQRPAPQAGQRPPAPGPARAAPRPAPSNQPAPQEEAQAPIQAPMPPVPDLPALPRGPAPPGAIIGLIGVPEVMRASAAAQLVDRVIGERREKLNEDAQKEQQAWRDLQQTLANQRTTLSPEQIRTKERELQDRITSAQQRFQNRGRIIQEAAQYGLNQIQASLIAVIRQVSESRGMNLVLHRQQVALNVNEFDITEQVAEQLNKLLPTVVIPPDGVSPNPPASAGTPAAAGIPAATPPAPPKR